MKHAPRCTLALVPGLLCDAAIWREQMQVLAPLAATWVPDFDTLDSIGAMAEQLLAQVPAERFALAGHSMGGRVALEVMRRAPERVQRLALLDTGWQPRAAGSAGETEAQQRAALLQVARTHGMRAMGERWAPDMLHPRCLGGPVHEDVLAMVERQPLDRYAGQIRALLDRPDAEALLPRIHCPTLLLCGKQDTWSPPARHQEMARRIPGARLVLVDDCGHMSPMEQPQAVSAALLDWLLWQATDAATIERWVIDAACRDTVARSARCVDERDPEGFAALFTEDAELVRPGAEPLRGRAAILAAYRARSPARITRHLVLGTIVEPHGASEAHAISRVLVWSSSTDQVAGPQGRLLEGAQVVGEFDDQLCLQADGRWRIRRREARFDMHTPPR